MGELIVDQDEQAICDLIGTWLRATRAGEVDTVLDLMTPDVVLLVTGQPATQGGPRLRRRCAACF